MAYLIAQGPQRQDRWRRKLPAEEVVLLGRGEGTWAAPWDTRISRRHARLLWQDDQLQVTADPEATNPIFYLGQPTRNCQLRLGEHFVIGATTFTLVDHQVKVSLELPHPVTEQVFPAEYLRHLAFRDARQQIEALSRLPELVAGADSDQELCLRLVNLLLTGISRARDVAVAYCDPMDPSSADIEILHWDRAAASSESFQPSGQSDPRGVAAATERGPRLGTIDGLARRSIVGPFRLGVLHTGPGQQLSRLGDLRGRGSLARRRRGHLPRGSAGRPEIRGAGGQHRGQRG